MKTPSRLIIKQYELGPLQNFLYLLADPDAKETTIVDPAWDVPFLCREAEKNGWTITQVFLTHGHPDHVNGLDTLLKTHAIPVYISMHEAGFYTPTCKDLRKIGDGERLKVGQIEFQAIHTPGHTPGCQCFLADGQLITGDTIFIDGCGRCDLPGGDAKKMYDSLTRVLMKLPDATVLWPGHNYGSTPTATLASQKKTNPYLQCSSLGEFLGERMGF